ncbi:MAG: hypothetical protein NTZ67_05330 [Gammaproteobacteria bacterium]|nr:hypothetical protein [Gammaproteobacteria bacterium]
MTHHCVAHDHHEHEKADFWTNSTAIVEAITSFTSMLYFTARMIDSVGNLDESVGGISFYGLGFGVAMAIYCTAGATYCHRTLNLLHQHANSAQIVVAVNSEPTANTALISKQGRQSGLTITQKILLFGDLIGHTAETAAPLTFMIALALHLQQWEKLAANGLCMAIGLFGSAANVRTCYQALNKKNSAEVCDGRSRSVSLATN